MSEAMEKAITAKIGEVETRLAEAIGDAADAMSDIDGDLFPIYHHVLKALNAGDLGAASRLLVDAETTVEGAMTKLRRGKAGLEKVRLAIARSPANAASGR